MYGGGENCEASFTGLEAMKKEWRRAGNRSVLGSSTWSEALEVALEDLDVSTEGGGSGEVRSKTAAED